MAIQVLNEKGEPVTLTPREQALAVSLQRKNAVEMRNALGAEIDITTLTAISKSVVEQKFFTIAPADYVPLRVGENAWSTRITTFRDFSVGGDFESGVVNTGANNSKIAEADSAVDTVDNKVMNWAKQISWSLFDLKQAMLSGNWDLVTSKERSRKRNWDLGIQQIAFWGSKIDSEVTGLLTQSDVAANTTLITDSIASASATDFSTIVQGLVEAYRANCERTAFPTHFIIPEGDYNALANLVPGTVGTHPVMMIEYLQKAFATITRNPNFKILPCAYADQTNNGDISALGKNRYTLLNYDEDTIRMDIPVDYTNTMQNSINNFNFQNVGFGQFTGVKAFRPKEVLYFDYTAA